MVLYIDTCYKILNVALYENDKVLLSYSEKLENNMTDKTLKYINKLFEESKRDISFLTKVIVVNGPGSFTGIRIGLTIAKTIAFSLNIPIITLSKLTSMSLSSNHKYKVPLISARRSSFFAAIFKNNEEILKETYIQIDELEFDNLENSKVNFEKVINYALTLEPTRVELVDANYLKKTEAEERNNL